MLANQYFMMRRYLEAMEIFEKIYPKEKRNVKVIAKLIICLIYNKNVDKAFQIFIDNVSNDPLIFFNTALKNEDCPCTDLITNMKTDNKSKKSPYKQLNNSNSFNNISLVNKTLKKNASTVAKKVNKIGDSEYNKLFKKFRIIKEEKSKEKIKDRSKEKSKEKSKDKSKEKRKEKSKDNDKKFSKQPSKENLTKNTSPIRLNKKISFFESL